MGITSEKEGSQREGVDQLHEEAVSGLVDGPRNREVMLVKNLGVTTKESEKTKRGEGGSAGRTFMNAYSLMAARRLMYIQLADWPLRR